MREGTTAAINEGSTLSTGGSNPVSRGDRIKHLVDSLKKSAWSTQQPVMNLLNEQAKTTATSLSATTFWISNQIYVADASMELLQRLRMESSIAEIREEQILTMGGHFKAEHSDDAEPRTKIHAWGVGKIGAEVVWAKGIMGANVTIATIDTGVRASHEALRSNFQGDYGWFDPETKSGAPFDLSGHGTHVMGSIVGVNGIWGALAISAAKDRSVVDNAAFHSSCGNISALMFPNNIFGYGRLDVDRAVQLLDAKA
ncbi:hypothetical protein PInf_020162 [Phytophthora infestans]|nr:hypothetical protein PInf_020162 [Phytophthora infestans]